MAVFDFSSVSGEIDFDPDADILAISGVTGPSDISVSESGGSTTITVGGNSVTLTGVTLSKLSSGQGLAATADTANVIISGASVYLAAGDDQSTTTSDSSGNTLTGVANFGHFLLGLGGGDTINVSASNEDFVIFGGTGAVDSSDGADTITTGTGGGTIYGNAGNDQITFDVDGSNTVTIYAGLGNDSLDDGGASGSGDATIFGNGGNDNIDLSNGAFAGDVTVYGGNGVADSSDGNDTVVLGTGTSLVYGNAGNDAVTLNQTANNASVYGGLGNDTVTNNAAGTGDYLIVLGQGTDSLNGATTDFGASSAVTVYGGDGAVDSADGADVIDIDTGATSTAVIYGNAGNDTVTADDNDTTSTVFGGLGDDSITTAANADSVVGGEGDDTIAAGAGANTVEGGEGDNNITTGAGDDRITAGAGDDTISSGDGADNVDAGAGDNSITVGNGDATVTGGADDDTVTAGNGNNLLVNGDAGADSLTVGNGTDATVNGGEGSDTIVGGTGGITLNGDAGNDDITGGSGVDTIAGGAGSDTIESGDGADSVTGGDDADTFQYAIALVDTTAANVDTITDLGSTDIFDFTDVVLANLNGTGASYQEGDASQAATALGANTGLFVATNAATSLSEANILTAIAGIVADAAIGAEGPNDQFYLLISDDTNAALVLVGDTDASGAIDAADDLNFVANLSGVTASELEALSASNFPDFA